MCHISYAFILLNRVIVNLQPAKENFYASGDPICRKEDCSPDDIGLVFQEVSALSAQDKFRFLENVWKQIELFYFPEPMHTHCRMIKRVGKHYCVPQIP